MGSIYQCQLSLPEKEATTIYKTITVGNKEVQVRFQWAVASEEQYNILLRYIDTKTNSDPLYIDGTYTYEYDYMDYYGRLIGKTEEQLSAWLDTNPVLPNSIINQDREAQIRILQQRITEVTALKPVLAQYKEVVKWQFSLLYDDVTTVGVIELGGWYRNQDPVMSFRFISELENIGRYDFNNVTMEFEVFDD